jgi:ADP-heptose:LPS heptosyltransferase
MAAVNRERDNITQFGHMLQNIAYHYGLRPRVMRPSLYLTTAECAWAIQTLQGLRRPVICLHPHTTSGPPPGHPWHADKWLEVIKRLSGIASFFELRLHGVEQSRTEATSFTTTLRQMFALVWAADLVICFDSLISHVAAAFERHAVVLWDPTRKVDIEERWQRGFALAALSRWSYPQHENVVLLGDREDEIVNVITRAATDHLWSFNA